MNRVSSSTGQSQVQPPSLVEKNKKKIKILNWASQGILNLEKKNLFVFFFVFAEKDFHLFAVENPTKIKYKNLTTNYPRSNYFTYEFDA